jgi:hypothetical protein
LTRQRTSVQPHPMKSAAQSQGRKSKLLRIRGGDGSVPSLPIRKGKQDRRRTGPPRPVAIGDQIRGAIDNSCSSPAASAARVRGRTPCRRGALTVENLVDNGEASRNGRRLEMGAAWAGGNQAGAGSCNPGDEWRRSNGGDNGAAGAEGGERRN